MRLRIRCQFITILFFSVQIVVMLWWFTKEIEPPQEFLQRLNIEGEQDIFHFTDRPISDFYSFHGREFCLREGSITEENEEGECHCKEDWLGKRCGIPKVIHQSEWMRDEERVRKLQLRKRPRRVIFVSPFSYEQDLFEVNVKEIGDLVDVFIIGEINQGSPNTNYTLLNKLKAQWLKEYQNKFIYVPVSGNVSHVSLVQSIVHIGMRLLTDVRPDDLFILTSGEEILRRDVLLFLKMFSGYPLPVLCDYQRYLYGFYWQILDDYIKDEPTVCATSIQMFANVYEYEVTHFQNGLLNKSDIEFFENLDQPVLPWTINPAGWHCHLCLSVQNIFKKLQDLPDKEKPKWLRDSAVSMLPFIQRLVKFGQDTLLVQSVKGGFPSKLSTPLYMWSDWERFKYLLLNPFEVASIHNLI